MRMHLTPHAAVLTVCLALAGGAPAAPAASPPPAAPPPPAPAAVPAAPPIPPVPTIDEAALRARMDAARSRMEVAAQQLAALSAQMSGQMMRRYALFNGSSHALIGIQLGRSAGRSGAPVQEVSPGGPAQQAGVRAGDVIVAVNGQDVRGVDAARRVVDLLRPVKPGEQVDLRVLRHGKSRDFAVRARPDMGEIFGGATLRLPGLAEPPFKALAAWGGPPMIIRGPIADMELARLTPGLGRYFGTDSGVLVVRAPPRGALGLQDGDVILSIGGRKPIDSSHVIRILASYDPGEKLTLEVLRLHRRIAVATTMPAQPPIAARRVLMIRRAGPNGGGAVVTLGPGSRSL
jgi:PDZ domain